MRIIPFSHELVGAMPTVDGPCVVYGSLGVQKLAASQGWKPGVWTNDGFSSTAYSQRLGELFLNHGLVRCRFSDVSTNARVLDWGTLFITPDSDGKAFAGTLVDLAEIDHWVENLSTSGLLAENDFDVVLARPRSLGSEWRTVVVGGQVVAFTLYREHQRATAHGARRERRAIAVRPDAPSIRNNAREIIKMVGGERIEPPESHKSPVNIDT